MLRLFGIITLIIAIGIAFMCFRIFLGRRFPNLHLDGNKAMRKKGIGCVQSMDAAERKENPHRVSEKHKTAK